MIRSLGRRRLLAIFLNLGEEALRNLDESGIVRIGAEVKAGDILGWQGYAKG